MQLSLDHVGCCASFPPITYDEAEPLTHVPLTGDLIAAETPFEDGTFRLVLTFEETYPNRPPTVKFLYVAYRSGVEGLACI